MPPRMVGIGHGTMRWASQRIPSSAARPAPRQSFTRVFAGISAALRCVAQVAAHRNRAEDGLYTAVCDQQEMSCTRQSAAPCRTIPAHAPGKTPDAGALPTASRASPQRDVVFTRSALVGMTLYGDGLAGGRCSQLACRMAISASEQARRCRRRIDDIAAGGLERRFCAQLRQAITLHASGWIALIVNGLTRCAWHLWLVGTSRGAPSRSDGYGGSNVI